MRLRAALLASCMAMTVPMLRAQSVDPTAVPVEFQKEPPSLGSRALLSTVMLAALFAVAAAVVVRARRSREMLEAGGGVHSLSSIRILNVRRASPRVTVMMMELAGRKVVAVADNGSSLIQIGEWDIGVDAETSHAKS